MVKSENGASKLCRCETTIIGEWRIKGGKIEKREERKHVKTSQTKREDGLYEEVLKERNTEEERKKNMKLKNIEDLNYLISFKNRDENVHHLGIIQEDICQNMIEDNF